MKDVIVTNIFRPKKIFEIETGRRKNGKVTLCDITIVVVLSDEFG